MLVCFLQQSSTVSVGPFFLLFFLTVEMVEVTTRHSGRRRQRALVAETEPAFPVFRRTEPAPGAVLGSSSTSGRKSLQLREQVLLF